MRSDQMMDQVQQRGNLIKSFAYIYPLNNERSKLGLSRVLSTLYFGQMLASSYERGILTLIQNAKSPLIYL